jgi:hypothetical protein
MRVAGAGNAGPSRRRLSSVSCIARCTRPPPHPIGALGQDLVGVLRRECHRREYLAKNSAVTRAWNTSDMLSRNAIREFRGHLRIGSRTESECIVTPKPGPLVRGSPSF